MSTYVLVFFSFLFGFFIASIKDGPPTEKQKRKDVTDLAVFDNNDEGHGYPSKTEPEGTVHVRW